MEYFLDGLVDYCWAGDNWLMMLDLSFCCALNTHTRAYFHLSSRLIVVFGQYDYPCYGYRDVWLILTDSLLYIGYPYWGIFSFPCQDFVCTVVWGWIIDVGYLPHDFDIGSYTRAYFPIFFEYPWDWNNDQLGFRLSTNIGLLTIDCIKTSLHGFVEIEMDRIKFHSRSIGGSFSQILMR